MKDLSALRFTALLIALAILFVCVVAAWQRMDAASHSVAVFTLAGFSGFFLWWVWGWLRT